MSKSDLEIAKIVKTFDNKLNSIKKDLDYLDYINPTNLMEEKEVFLLNYFSKKEVYNPTFSYKSTQKVQTSLSDLKDLIAQMKEAWEFIFKNGNKYEKLVFKILKKEVDFSFQRALMIISIGKDDVFHELSKRIFGTCLAKTVSRSKARVWKVDCLIDKTDGQTSLSENEIILQTANFLKDNNITGWDVSFEKISGPAMVSHTSKTVRFNKDYNYSEKVLEILFAHEILGHVIQNINSEKNYWNFLADGLGVYETLHEGYALEKEFAKNPNLLNRLDIYYISVDFGLKNSFHKTFSYIYKNLLSNPNEAFILTARIKRGLSNTSLLGGFAKDKVYLEGFNFVKTATEFETNLISKAKFGLENLKDVKNLLKL